MTKLLDGSYLQDFIKNRQAHQVRGLIQHFKVQPRLAIIQSQDDPIASLYLKIKQSYGQDIGIETIINIVNQSEIDDLIKQLNQDPAIQGIIVQLPLDDSSQTDQIVNLIAPKKDVDSLGKKSIWDSPTATAISWLLAGYNIDLKNKSIAIVGQGRLVGSPLAKMWRSSNLDVVTIDSKETNLEQALLDKDLIVSATGKSNLITSSMIKPGAVLVDAGTASEKGQIVGDFTKELYHRTDLTITPIKGGVGPLTVAALFDNVIKASY